MVFTPTCATSGCHSGGAPAAGLNLQAGNAYAELVGIASSQDAGLMRVNPGNPDDSYLIRKLEGTASSGQQMPPGAPLAQAEIDVIRQWITDGAVDDTVQPTVPVRVSSISPAPNANLDAGPMQLVAGFDRDLDASTVNPLTFLLEGSGGDGSFNDGNEVPIDGTGRVSVGANPASAIFDLQGVTLADDTYRMSLLGNGANVIMDLEANALDGEYLGVFPSGNGAAGGDFVVTFTVTTPVVLGPTLDQIQAVVFTPDCASCHSGAGAVLPGSMDLSNADASRMNLVNIDSVNEPGIIRVVPGDPDNSYLIDKLEGTHTVGGIMPPSGMLPQATIDEIRQWIVDGAQR